MPDLADSEAWHHDLDLKESLDKRVYKMTVALYVYQWMLYKRVTPLGASCFPNGGQHLTDAVIDSANFISDFLSTHDTSLVMSSRRFPQVLNRLFRLTS